MSRIKVVPESTLPIPADVCAAQRAQLLADFRAKVEALRDEAMDHSRTTGDQSFAGSIVAYMTVLALIDGSSDE